MSRYTLYVKQDCGLCEEFIHELRGNLPGQMNEFAIVDITGKTDLLRLYGDKIPVVTKGEQVICQYFFDPDVFK